MIDTARKSADSVTFPKHFLPLSCFRTSNSNFSLPLHNRRMRIRRWSDFDDLSFNWTSVFKSCISSKILNLRVFRRMQQIVKSWDSHMVRLVCYWWWLCCLSFNVDFQFFLVLFSPKLVICFVDAHMLHRIMWIVVSSSRNSVTQKLSVLVKENLLSCRYFLFFEFVVLFLDLLYWLLQAIMCNSRRWSLFRIISLNLINIGVFL